jgi:hypothetical protein
MAEETQDARRAAPRSIMGTVLCTACMGLMYLLGLLFSTPDVTALEEPVQVPGPTRPCSPLQRAPLTGVTGCWRGWRCAHLQSDLDGEQPENGCARACVGPGTSWETGERGWEC